MSDGVSGQRRAEIDATQDDAGRIALEFDIEKFPRRAFLDAVAQPQELLLALLRSDPGGSSSRSMASVEMAQGTSVLSFIIVNSTTMRLKS